MPDNQIEVINPIGRRETKRGHLAPRDGRLEGKTVGLLDNSKPNSDNFLECVGQLLQERYQGIEIVFKRKMSRTEADCLPELIEKCDAVISAFAD